MKKAVINIMILIISVCMFVIAPNTGLTQDIQFANIFMTPATNTGPFGGLIGGNATGSFDWSIGNCQPFTKKTDDWYFHYSAQKN